MKLKWFTESFATATLLRIESYTMYTASIVSRVPSPSQRLTADEKRRKEILERARKDAERNAADGERYTNDRPRFVRHRNTDELAGSSPRQRRDMEQLLELSKSMRVGRRPSTPEFEDALVKGRELENMPVWVKRKVGGCFLLCRSLSLALVTIIQASVTTLSSVSRLKHNR